ncbi:MAG: hypothetical protein HFI37_07535 [Lachnospiraceae bacterium]|nr:hypothetical protein [Lachnospiraceae bacterium]
MGQPIVLLMEKGAVTLVAMFGTVYAGCLCDDRLGTASRMDVQNFSCFISRTSHDK